jgi:hypothetical protein
MLHCDAAAAAADLLRSKTLFENGFLMRHGGPTGRAGGCGSSAQSSLISRLISSKKKCQLFGTMRQRNDFKLDRIALDPF